MRNTISLFLAIIGLFSVTVYGAPIYRTHTADLARPPAPTVEAYEANVCAIEWTLKNNGAAVDLTSASPFMWWAESTVASGTVMAACEIVEATSGVFRAVFSSAQMNAAAGQMVYGVGVDQDGTQTFRRGALNLEADPYATGTNLPPMYVTNLNWGLISWLNLPDWALKSWVESYVSANGASGTTDSIARAGVASNAASIVEVGAVASNAVPYTGATTDVNLGTNLLKAGHIGIYTNDNVPTSPIQVGGYLFEPYRDNQITVSRYVTNSAGVTNAHAFADSSYIDRTGSMGYNSYDIRTTFGGTENYDHISGYQFMPTYNSSGKIGWMAGYYTLPIFMNAGSVSNYYGFFAGQPNIMNSTFKMTNSYAFYAKEVTNGVNNWAFYSEGSTPSKVGGEVMISKTNSYPYINMSTSPYSSSAQAQVFLNAQEKSATAGSSSLYSYLDSTDVDRPGITTLASFLDSLYITGTQSYQNVYGTYFAPTISTSGTVQNVIGNVSQGKLENGIVDNYYGFLAANPSLSATPATVGSTYGFAVSTMTRGQTNWAFYHAGSNPSRFGPIKLSSENIVTNWSDAVVAGGGITSEEAGAIATNVLLASRTALHPPSTATLVDGQVTISVTSAWWTVPLGAITNAVPWVISTNGWDGGEIPAMGVEIPRSTVTFAWPTGVTNSAPAESSTNLFLFYLKPDGSVEVM